MLKTLKLKIKENKLLSFPVVFIYRLLKKIYMIPHEIHLYKTTKMRLKNIDEREKVFYIGIPAHANLGDLAQGVCIKRWIRKHYPEWQLIEIETNALVNTHFSLLKMLKSTYRDGDIIIFQSGYTTTDLGGFADEMHCQVIKALPEAKILMMPQTIFFERENRRKRTAQIYNSNPNMLFLARDKVSYEMALSMFPDLTVMLYPDIVTTLIGTKFYTSARDGILFCCRDDSEKFYSDAEINNLMEQCSAYAQVQRTDTTKSVDRKNIIKNASDYILAEIEQFSHYKVIITDRYHGTIFSLIAGTPVIIIKTTDHKVTTGAEWFKGIYDDYVYVSESLDEAAALARQIYNREFSHRLPAYFEAEYYDKLPDVFKKNNC